MSAKGLRRVRTGQVAALILNAAILVLDLMGAHPVIALVPLFCIVALSVGIRMNSGTIRRREYMDRPRPDYSAIAAMELPIWGRTFEHEGAPAGQRADGSYATLRVTCNQGHGGQIWADGRSQMCPACDRQRDEHRSNLRWERRS